MITTESEPRYVIRSIKEYMRGQSGTIVMYYVWDNKLKTRSTGTTPIKRDCQEFIKSVTSKENSNESERTC